MQVNAGCNIFQPHRAMKRTRWIFIIPVLLLLAVTLPHLEQGDFRVETAHYGAIGVQAWRTPSLFWTLHEHPSVAYFNKPPLVFWIHGLILHVLGITLTAVRLPTILAAAGCILLATSLTYRLMGRISALLTGSILALSYEFFRRTREISLDMWQLFFMLAATWLVVSAARTNRKLHLGLAGASLGLALLCKPLMAFLVPIIFVFWKYSAPGILKSLRFRDFGLILLTALFVAAPWHLSMIHLHGDVFTDQYLGHEVGHRMKGLLNDKPVWYYGQENIRTYWPWAILLIAGLIRWHKGTVSLHHRQTLQAAASWFVVWAVVLSLFPDKRPRYALPLYPSLAMISAFGLATLPWMKLRHWYRYRLPMIAAWIIIVALAVAIMPIRFQSPPDPALSALVDWARKQDPTNVYSAALLAVDESMIYLKAGYWPTPLAIQPNPGKGSFIIYGDAIGTSSPPAESCVFKKEPYRVMQR